MKKFWILGLLLAPFLMGNASADVAVPQFKHWVTDLSAALTPAQEQSLDLKLASFEKSKGSQVAVLIVPTTQPETIEQYSIRVAQAWRLGRKKVDDGVLVVFSAGEHKVRIEVGYGLEGALNDATANRIIDEIIIPNLKKKQFYAGIDLGVSAIIRVINGEPLPAVNKGGVNLDSSWAIVLFVIIGIGLVAMLFSLVTGESFVLSLVEVAEDVAIGAIDRKGGSEGSHFGGGGGGSFGGGGASGDD